MWSTDIPHWSRLTHFCSTSSSTVPAGHWQPTTHWAVHTTGPGSLQVGGHAVPHVVNTWPSIGHDSTVRESDNDYQMNDSHSLGWHFTTGGQGALTHWTSCSEHVSFDAHPPLSRSHDGSQNASPVGWNTLHVEPVGHSKFSHGSTISNNIVYYINCSYGYQDMLSEYREPIHYQYIDCIWHHMISVVIGYTQQTLPSVTIWLKCVSREQCLVTNLANCVIYMYAACYHSNIKCSPQTGQHSPGGTSVSTPGAQFGRAHKTAYKKKWQQDDIAAS